MAVDIAIAHLREARRSKFSIASPATSLTAGRGRHLTATFFGPWCDVPAQRRGRSS